MDSINLLNMVSDWQPNTADSAILLLGRFVISEWYGIDEHLLVYLLVLFGKLIIAVLVINL